MPLLNESEDVVTTAAFAQKRNKKRTITEPTAHATSPFSKRSQFFSFLVTSKATSQEAAAAATQKSPTTEKLLDNWSI